jgi:hypothetical protein
MDISSTLTLLQAVQVKANDFSYTTTGPSSSSCHDEMGNRWREVSQRIRIDSGLDEKGQRQL